MKLCVPVERSKLVDLAVIAIALMGMLLVALLAAGVAPLAFYYIYAIVSAIVGLALYFALRRYDQPLRRRLVLFPIGTSLFSAAMFRDPVEWNG